MKSEEIKNLIVEKIKNLNGCDKLKTILLRELENYRHYASDFYLFSCLNNENQKSELKGKIYTIENLFELSEIGKTHLLEYFHAIHKECDELMEEVKLD